LSSFNGEYCLVVTEILNDSLKLKVGDIITHIDGELSEDYFEEVYSRISYGTDGFRNYKAKTQGMLGIKVLSLKLLQIISLTN